MSENLQPTCNQLATDCISRQAAIKAICEDGTWLESQGCTEITMAERKQRDADILGELPSAEPKRKMGKTLAEEVERIKREITDIFAKQMGVQIEVIVDECKQAQKDFADMRVGDTIYRQAAIDVLEREKVYGTLYKDDYSQTDYFKQYNSGLTDGIKAIKALPSAERKRGEWTVEDIYGSVSCSVCGCALEDWIQGAFYNFCPYCGADMRGEKNE